MYFQAEVLAESDQLLEPPWGPRCNSGQMGLLAADILPDQFPSLFHFIPKEIQLTAHQFLQI